MVLYISAYPDTVAQLYLQALATGLVWVITYPSVLGIVC